MEDQRSLGRATLTLNACAVCNSTLSLKRCSRCKVIFYCSREHQKEDWIHHKSLCTQTLAGQSPIVRPRGSETDTVTEPDNHVGSITRPVFRDAIENMSDETQAEIKDILDFSTVTSPNNAKPQTKEEKKEIFFELLKSDSGYAGPSESTDSSYNNIIDTLCNQDMIRNDKCIEQDGASESSTQTEVPMFNTHPFRKLRFPKPDSYDLPEVAYFISLRLTQLGYCILDDAFEETLISGIISEVTAFHEKNELCRGDTLNNTTDLDYRNDMIKWLDGQSEGSEYISKGLAFMDSLIELMKPHLRQHCNIQGRTEAMIACYPEDGSYFRHHVDNTSKDGRCITCTLYLNRDWSIERDGGLMRMFPPKQEKPVDVPPLANRLLIFWSDGRTPHEIHPAYRNRYSMTVWYYDKDEKDAFKVDKLKRETDEIYDRISALEEDRRQLQEITSAQLIRNRAMEAVQALTSGELQALSFLIDHHPNPKEALTAMGISEAIQDALVVHLSSQDPGQ
ncbi:Egl nine-like protein 1 [Elysia marginata]|uniref:hypoxia-inducible factor-proline dioxygenase n=1 Tax=Elysia marginata TaxID=1093978 RepID=A0AAV4GVS1_9GAST|nr:Egl nine-like protein 1 [Elysia marginata]